MTPKSKQITVRLTGFELGRLTNRYPTVVDVKAHVPENHPVLGQQLYFIVTTTTAAIENVFTPAQAAGILACTC